MNSFFFLRGHDRDWKGSPSFHKHQGYNVDGRGKVSVFPRPSRALAADLASQRQFGNDFAVYITREEANPNDEEAGTIQEQIYQIYRINDSRATLWDVFRLDAPAVSDPGFEEMVRWEIQALSADYRQQYVDARRARTQIPLQKEDGVTSSRMIEQLPEELTDNKSRKRNSKGIDSARNAKSNGRGRRGNSIAYARS